MIELLVLSGCQDIKKIRPDTFCKSLYIATYTSQDLEIISDELLKFLDDYQSYYLIHCK